MERGKSDICPCAKCSPETRQSCCGCPEYSEWLQRNYAMKEDNVRLAIHVEDSDVKRNFSDWEQYSDFQSKYMYNEDMDMAIDSLDMDKYGSKELDLLTSVNELIRKYFDDNIADLTKSITESNQKHLSKNPTSKWHYVLPDADYPDPFTRVIVSVHENVGNAENVYNERWYTDIASYVGGDDRLWISADKPVCGVVVAWIELPDPV